MVLFVCDHYAGLTEMIALRYTYHTNQECILLIGADKTKEAVYQELEKNKIFNRILQYNCRIGAKEGDINKTRQTICHYFDTLFSDNGIAIQQTSKIYTCSDLLSGFPIYLTQKGISYAMCELSANQLADLHRYDASRECNDADEAYVALEKECCSLHGHPKLTIQYFLDPETTAVGHLPKDRIVVFDVLEKLKAIKDADIKEKILNSFSRDFVKQKIIDTLIITNSTGYMKHSGLADHQTPLLYELLLDYYAKDPEKLYLKLHPYCWSGKDFLTEFTDATVLSQNFPLELIGLCDDIHISQAVLINSTATNKIKSQIGNEVNTGYSFYKNFRLLHQLFVCYSLVEYLKYETGSFHQKVKDYNFLCKFLEYVFPLYSKKEIKGINLNILNGKIFTVIDSCPPTGMANICTGLKHASKDAITAFLNVDNRYDFYSAKDPELAEDMVPLRIKKIPLRNHVLANLDNEYVYIFSKDEVTRSKVRQFSLRKQLKYTGIEIQVEPMTMEEEEKVRLNMRLAAVERDLSEVMSWKDKLIKKIQELI